MAFANTDFIVANDLNNMLRGLHKNNADSAHTGDTNETDLSTLAITGGTIGTTGAIHVIAAGAIAGTAGAKTIKLDFGSTNLGTVNAASGSTNNWYFDVWIFNTATNAQRVVGLSIEGTNIDGLIRGSASEDTTASVTLKCTATLGNGGDTVTQSIFNVDIVQRT